MTEHLDDSAQQFAPLFGANNAISGTVANSVDAAASNSIQGDRDEGGAASGRGW